MTITRVGTNQQYADGWEKAFSAKRGGAKSAANRKQAARQEGQPKPKKASAKKGRK